MEHRGESFAHHHERYFERGAQRGAGADGGRLGLRHAQRLQPTSGCGSASRATVTFTSASNANYNTSVSVPVPRHDDAADVDGQPAIRRRTRSACGGEYVELAGVDHRGESLRSPSRAPFRMSCSTWIQHRRWSSPARSRTTVRSRPAAAARLRRATMTFTSASNANYNTSVSVPCNGATTPLTWTANLYPSTYSVAVRGESSPRLEHRGRQALEVR